MFIIIGFWIGLWVREYMGDIIECSYGIEELQ